MPADSKANHQFQLSATMLSDNSEKSRNPIKKAMRRRNAKTVQFAAPTYVEASDYDYSSDEEGDLAEYINGSAIAAGTQQAATEEAAVEQKEAPAETRTSTSSNRASFDREQAATAASALAAAGVTDDEPQLSPKLVDKTGKLVMYECQGTALTAASEAAPLKSRKGTPRNADSFLKDDTIETRKITLTPGLLREDNAPLRSPTESTRTASMESLTKVSMFESDKKDEKKKKGGMLSGFFKSKKKDKKSKDSGNDLDEKVSLDIVRSSSISSDKNSIIDRSSNGQAAQNAAQGRMQQTSSTTTAAAAAAPQQTARAAGNAGPESNQVFLAELPGSEVAQEMATGQESAIRPAPKPLTSILKTSDKPKKAKKSKKRIQLDDFDTPAEERRNPFDDGDDDDDDDGGRSGSRTFMHGTEIIHIPMPGEMDEDEDDDDEEEEEDSEEEEEEEEEPGSLTSSLNTADAAAASTPTPVDSALERKSSAASSIKRDETTDRAATTTPTIASPTIPSTSRTTTPLRGFTPLDSLSPPPLTTAPSPTASTPSQSQGPAHPWNDHHLRAWLEDGREVRDMLVMIHDKSGVTPVSNDHPLMAGLYTEQRKGVQDMMGQLDGLLGAYLNRKGVRY
jgi:hypothetical protein